MKELFKIIRDYLRLDHKLTPEQVDEAMKLSRDEIADQISGGNYDVRELARRANSNYQHVKQNL